MKLITRKNFISIVCISFTVLVIFKLVYEKVIGLTDVHYTENIFLNLGLSVLITLILALHSYLQKFPFIPVFIGQYVVTVGVVLGFVWSMSRFVSIAPTAYRDMFLSVTLPFIVLAAVYYITFFRQIRKANEMIEQMNLEEE